MKLIDCSKITENIFLGGSKSSKERTILHSLGVTHIVVAAGKQRFGGEFEYHMCHFTDDKDSNIIPLIPNVVSFMRSAIEKGGRVLVHCQGGISRSPSIVIAYLMCVQNITFCDAKLMVEKMKPNIRPNPGFTSSLKEYEISLGISA